LKERADAQFAHDDFKNATQSYKAALDVLKYHYNSDQHDDTGTKLSLAEYEIRRGHLRESALIRQRVLDDRLQLCGMRK